MTIWKRYSLGITLAIMFLVAWALMTWTDWMQFVAQEAEHHQPADVFGASGYIWQWGLDTFSNWQADFLGIGLGIVTGAYLIFRGSEQSRDTSDEVQEIVQDIERQVRGPQAASQAQGAAQAQIYRGGNLRRYGLGYLFLGGFLAAWALMTWMGWMQFAAQAKEHGEAADVFGASGYIWYWMRQTFMNWQADALGHAVLVIVPAYLLFKGSAESRESMDRVKAVVRRVQSALHSQAEGQSGAGSLVRETRPAQTPEQPVSFWKKYALAIPPLVLFVGSWILQTWSGWNWFVGEQLQHHAVADVFGPSGYIWVWGADTFSNWQSDLLWGGLIVLLGAYLIYQGSAESKDSDERIEQLADDIETRVRGPQRARQAQTRTARQMSAGGIWRNRGLAYSLILAGLIAWALMTWMGWMYFMSSQQEHRSAAELFGASGYVWDWATLTLENWQSDIMGNMVMVIASAYLLYKGSSISRGSDDEIEQALQRIQQALIGKQGGAQPQTVPAEQLTRSDGNQR